MAALIESDIGDHLRGKLRERVRKMARFFIRDARVDNGTYVWNYATWTPGVEDVSHAGIDVEFIAAAGHVKDTSVGDGDIKLFMETFRRITNDESKVDHLVNGAGGGDQKDNDQACGRWLALASYDRTLIRRCDKAIEHDDPMSLGFARTLRYR